MFRIDVDVGRTVNLVWINLQSVRSLCEQNSWRQ